MSPRRIRFGIIFRAIKQAEEFGSGNTTLTFITATWRGLWVKKSIFLKLAYTAVEALTCGELILAKRVTSTEWISSRAAKPMPASTSQCSLATRKIGLFGAISGKR